MPASRLRAFLELSIDGLERAVSIIRRHSCAWQAVSDSQARSSGSSSRPSGVIRRSPRKEKPAQGPVKSIRWCGSNTIMPRSHPWSGIEDAGKSRARGPAIATRSRRTVPRSIHFLGILVYIYSVAWSEGAQLLHLLQNQAYPPLHRKSNRNRCEPRRRWAQHVTRIPPALLPSSVALQGSNLRWRTARGEILAPSHEHLKP